MSSTPLSTEPSGATASRASTLLRAAGLAWLAALVLNLALFVLATGPFGVDLLHPDPPGSTDLTAVVLTDVLVSTTAGSLAALAFAALLARFVPRPRRTFLVVASVAAVLSLGGPLSISGASTGNTVVLLAMHVLAAVALIPLIGRALPDTRGGAS